MILAQNKKIAALTSNYRSQLVAERTEVVGQIAKLEQDHRKMTFKAGLLELRAPQSGVVKDIATTTKGAVVQPGMVLLTLVPKGEELLAEVQIRNEDVGFVHVGQTVRLKVAAYPFQKYGLLEGTMQTVAPDAQTGQPGGANTSVAGYKGIVRLQRQALESQAAQADKELQAIPLRLDPGMRVSAEIHQGRRTVMEYLLSPLRRASQEAGREP